MFIDHVLRASSTMTAGTSNVQCVNIFQRPLQSGHKPDALSHVMQQGPEILCTDLSTATSDVCCMLYVRWFIVCMIV
jgi:hypothetical protein